MIDRLVLNSGLITFYIEKEWDMTKKILIVEDEKDFQEMYAGMFEGRGYNLVMLMMAMKQCRYWRIISLI